MRRSAIICLHAIVWLAPAAGASAQAIGTPAMAMSRAAAPDMLGTTAIQIQATRFGDNLSRALQDSSRSPLMQRLIAPARGISALQQLAYVQSRVSTNIRWMSDATEWGRHDYWATAEQTLAQGAGDMDNRAIVKLQALRALGFPANDLFLTLARDSVGGPITVVSARIGGHFYILDDTGGAPFQVETRHFEFQPVLSFGWAGAWVHTHRVAAPPVRVAAASTAPVSR